MPEPIVRTTVHASSHKGRTWGTEPGQLSVHKTFPGVGTIRVTAHTDKQGDIPTTTLVLTPKNALLLMSAISRALAQIPDIKEG